ncbi:MULTISPECIES: transcriptional regulator NrdR [unclassified Aeromicrobium]|uniref:transcriptional regulator NrdR n=1 Tax=unclassified Aeromicrobium TaxID=2633570 RepID=UPI0006F8C373|nr:MULTISPECIES: transcriptional regulator NrdR [unclassified Aeromicrobium]RYY44363.1 MAG: transcriptional repressor NrdR [Actinomycetales bacterium]KQO38888.1 transcriptional repressor NrdR [Aeromicrobium sp. Leaf245]KQP25652.1 transcriptional repressor NrdR [Aeromicrobium sp. Leaf272]KQP79775.1 transcriptional repressor NrdR [Aeromicrobium sp. Leaf289]KQP82140.1 transcriptional repressor NrdR [Aeromicrobium sp. Leaf291]
MHCPFCKNPDTRVLDSRVAEEGGAIRRRRVCGACEKRFTTIEQMQLTVLKRSGATEPFNRDKAISGVRKACKGRPVSDDDLARLGQQVEDALRESGAAEIAAHEVGLAILDPLKSLDEVAYLRFASVYKAFDSVDDFAAEIAVLMARAADGELAEHTARQLP